MHTKENVRTLRVKQFFVPLRFSIERRIITFPGRTGKQLSLLARTVKTIVSERSFVPIIEFRCKVTF